MWVTPLFFQVSLPSAVTPGSITNTVVDAIILWSSSSSTPLCLASDLPSDSGSVMQRVSTQSSVLQIRMSHWRWTVLESGNRNMEYSFEDETPLEESNTNWERTLRCGHLNNITWYKIVCRFQSVLQDALLWLWSIWHIQSMTHTGYQSQ